MYLKRLEIHGFKSFATKTTMEFAQGIIAIVGPNGSGKSNVADSLRWVLGEQSAKMMRGKKSDDVIFAGSDKKGKFGFAEVVATFDNRDRRIPLDSAEVSIGRRVDRSGESEYLINNNKVRLLDIVDLVLKSNIGTSRYTVIGQGTIDQMVLAGPSEVKNLLDEASGVKTYYIKREKTLRRLEQTAQNLMRAEDLIAEIEPRLKSLRRQAKKMEARAEFETELKVYQREFLGMQYWQLKEVIDGHASQVAKLEEQRMVFEGEMAELRLKAENIETTNTDDIGKFKEIQTHLSSLQGKKNKLLEDLSLVRGKMQSQKTAGVMDPKTLQVELHEISRRLLELKDLITKTTEERNQAQTAAKKQQELVEAVNNNIDQLYKHSQSPVSIDWNLFELEIKKLEDLLNQLHTGLGQGLPQENLRVLTENLQNQFSNFKKIAKDAAISPEASMSKFQGEMKELLAAKEKLTNELSQLELAVSKAAMSLDFLAREQSNLEQKKLHVDLELKKAESNSADDFLAQLITEETRISGEVEALAKEIAEIETLFNSQREAQNELQKQLHDIETMFRNKQDQVNRVKDQETQVVIEKTKYDTQMESLNQEVLRTLGVEAWENISSKKTENITDDVENKIYKLKNQLEMIGGMDELTLKEYQETETRFNTLSTQVEDLKRGMQDLRSVMDELDEHIKSKFNEAFYKINEKFEYYFRILFNGGRAYLSVLKAEEEKAAQDAENLTEGTEDLVNDAGTLRPEEKIVQKYERGASNIVGIDIKATPPNKKLASIQALSGGERALTSIALLCSLLTCFPSPFVVLDEVDAALDDANTIRFGQILGTLAHQTQFITITHNRETMAQANILYGVTMGDDGISKLLSVKLDQAKQFAK